MGTAFMEALDNPFTVIDTLLEEIDTPNILVDFHAEATSEKRAMGWYLSGRVSAVIGTHTHVQTADAEILDGKTGYLTDVGMTGGARSVLGVNVGQAIAKQRFHRPVQFTEAGDPCIVNAVLIANSAFVPKWTPFLQKNNQIHAKTLTFFVKCIIMIVAISVAQLKAKQMHRQANVSVKQSAIILTLFM